MYVCMYLYMCTHTHTHAHTHARTYICVCDPVRCMLMILNKVPRKVTYLDTKYFY